MGEENTVQLLTSLFQNLHSTGKYASLKLWTGDDNEVRFFFTNNPLPRKHGPDNSKNVEKSPLTVQKNLSHSVTQSSPVMETRSKKRKISQQKTSKTKTPEIVREKSSCEDGINVSHIELESPCVYPTVSCSNRFSLLENLMSDAADTHQNTFKIDDKDVNGVEECANDDEDDDDCATDDGDYGNDADHNDKDIKNDNVDMKKCFNCLTRQTKSEYSEVCHECQKMGYSRETCLKCEVRAPRLFSLTCERCMWRY